MKTISIANQKGGCGKTTTSINLAAAMSRNGKRILLIDLDPQAHASLGLNFENQDSLYNVISKLTPRKLNIKDIIRPVEDGFDIAPSNILVGTLEQELADEIGRELKLTEIIDEIREDYDYILIDCPPSLGFLTINSIRASQEVIIPVETSRFSLQGVEHLMDIINLIRDRLNHNVDFRILITMFDSRLRHSFSMLSHIREKFSDVLLDTIIHVNVKLKESAAMGQTVAAYDKYCRGSKDYFSLAKEVIATDAITEAEPSFTKFEQKPAEKARVQATKAETEAPVAVTEQIIQEAEKVANRVNEEVTGDDGEDEEVTQPEEAPGTETPDETPHAPEEIPESPETPAAVAEDEEEADDDEWQQIEEEEEEQEEITTNEAQEDKEEALKEEEAVTYQEFSDKMKEMVREETKDFVINTRFSLEAPDARSVYVTGSFNDWSLDESCRMKADGDGNWYVDVNLKPGVYKYQFIVDGRWREDPSNPRQERNSFGDINSLLEVSDNDKD